MSNLPDRDLAAVVVKAGKEVLKRLDSFSSHKRSLEKWIVDLSASRQKYQDASTSKDQQIADLNKQLLAQQVELDQRRTTSADHARQVLEQEEAMAQLRAENEKIKGVIPAQIDQSIHDYMSFAHFTGALKVLLAPIFNHGYTMGVDQANEQCPKLVIENLPHGGLRKPGGNKDYEARHK